MIKVLKKSERQDRKQFLFAFVDMTERESDRAKLGEVLISASVMSNQEHLDLIETFKSETYVKEFSLLKKENVEDIAVKAIDLLESEVTKTSIMLLLDEMLTKRELLFATIAFSNMVNRVIRKLEEQLVITTLKSRLDKTFGSNPDIDNMSKEEVLAKVKSMAKDMGIDIGSAEIVKVSEKKKNTEDNEPMGFQFRPGEA